MHVALGVWRIKSRYDTAEMHGSNSLEKGSNNVRRHQKSGQWVVLRIPSLNVEPYTFFKSIRSEKKNLGS
jgi:hypothetical protein